MSLRSGVLALAGAVTAAALATAQPPRGAPVEGREPDPVVRQFHAAEPSTFGYGSGPATPAAGGEVAWPAIDFLTDLLPNQLTMPLGTVPMWD